MSIKLKYRLYCRIAIGIAAVVGAITTWNLSKSLDVNFIMIFFGAFSSCTHFLFLIIGYRKEKAIDKKFGFIKISGDRWLGYDGFWHDGLKEIYERKLDRYYKNGGDDFGYLPSLYMRIAFLLFGCVGGLATMVGEFELSFEEFFATIAVLLAFLVYAIFRRAVFG